MVTLLSADSLLIVSCCVICTQLDAVPGGRRKPEPGMLLEAMTATGVHERTSCIFIGDSDTDMQVQAVFL
jgi:histidinol phosphatase-like enzyme